MLVRDQKITEKIMRIGKHYNENVATRFLRPAFAGILSDINISHSISDLTEHSEDFIMQGTHLEDLYTQILAMANFIFLVNQDIVPKLYSLSDASVKIGTDDKVYRKMAFHNLPSNLKVLAEMLQDLYESALEFDKSHNKRRKKIFHEYPELDRLGDLLSI